MLLLLLAAVPADFAPCTEGLVIEYQAGEVMVTDTVKGTDPRKLCRIERVTDRRGAKETDTYLLELLQDRVLSAGYASTPLALRPPLLVGPIEAGTHWRFNRADFRIRTVGPCKVGELSFDLCATVERRGEDGSKQETVFAHGVGIVEQSFGSVVMRARAVRLPKSKTAGKSSRDARR
jgi:hypothetical protein